MTVVTVVAIAAIAAFFYAFVWPSIKGSITNSTKCSQAVCGQCSSNGTKRTCTCTYVDENGKVDDALQCTFNDSDSKNNNQAK